MARKHDEYDAAYWAFMHKLLNVFGKYTPAVFAVVIGVVTFTAFFLVNSAINQPVAYGTPPAAEAAQEAQEPANGAVLAGPDAELLKQRFLASYEDSFPGNNAEWSNWAFSWGVNACSRLDAGDTLADIRADIPDDQYKNNRKLITKDAILVMCPHHYDELSLPADYTKSP